MSHCRCGLRRWPGPFLRRWKNPMRYASQYFAWAAVAAVLSIDVAANAARAQGSAGGSIGNDDKSVSGSRPETRTVEPDRRARHGGPEAETPQRAARKNSGGSNFDGAWVFSSVGRPCGAATETAVITGGRISGQWSSGQVSPSGSTTGHGAAGGVSWTSSGHLTSRGGSGSFRRSDGCAGTWTASRQ